LSTDRDSFQHRSDISHVACIKLLMYSAGSSKTFCP